VREHHRKIRKVEKIKAKKGGLTLNAMKKKDPGIPSMWPFKEELLKEVDEYKDTVFHPPILPHPICFHLFRYCTTSQHARGARFRPRNPACSPNPNTQLNSAEGLLSVVCFSRRFHFLALPRAR
jgi:hypothetical protein